jgi:glycosidase
MLLVMLVSSVLMPAQRGFAASFRNRVAQVPAAPTSSQSVRVWMQSDTALGETAGLEYNVGSSYIKVLGTFDTGGPAPANWRADIPAQANGTTVRYQLFTRNQSGQDYGFTGFNWSYSVDSGDIHWNGLRHDSFDSYYRAPFGAVAAGTSVTLRFRTERLDVEGVALRVYQYNPATDTTSGPVDYPLSYLEDRVENGTSYAIWSYTLATPSTPAILYYKFRVTDRLDEDFYSDDYTDDHDNVRQGGPGAPSDNEPFPSFQITVYDPAFQTPSWLQNANVYQIFPDRFRNGDPSNDYCRPGGTTGCPTFYGDQQVLAHTTWNEAIGDPRQAGPYLNTYGTQFFGGDLKGIEDKLDYLQGLGIDTLYLTPIFKASSNHRYDTDDYLEVDPALGGDAAFTSLVREMERRGMYLILDGVFNHTSSDSRYFDRYHRYSGDGACETQGSTYRTWYEFATANVPCGSGDYTGWFGYDSLAVLKDDSAAVRDFIYRTGADNVVKHWYDRGAAGWRFDVADEISHNWWRDFRPYAKAGKSDGPLIGEVWYDASKFLLGDQLDSVMNYRFRKNILGFARGTAQWSDNDNNGGNPIVPLTPSQFDQALKSVREDYPAQATAAMLNLIDSHDTNRALYVLTLLGDTGLNQAKERLRLSALFQFTYLGAPTIYYGDEAAIDSPSLANGVNGPEDDPYNRAPYPWADESGDTGVYGPADSGMIGYYSTLAHLRQQHPALRTGAVATLLTGDTTASGSDNSTYAFARVGGGEQAVIALNNGAGTNTATVPVSAYFADGTALQDALSGTTYTVSGGAINVTLAARSGAILFAAPAAADTAAPSAAATANPAPNANGYHNTTPVTVNLSGSDSGSGIKELRYWVNNGNVTVTTNSSAAVTITTPGTTVVNVRAVDKAGNISPLVSATVMIDTTAPNTTLDTTPPALSNTSSAGFSFGSEPGATFQCKLDSGSFGPCASPLSFNNLADGGHSFAVKATDLAGNTDASPATFTWTIDTTAPSTTITSGPAALTASNAASFGFSGSENGGTFQCSLDGSAFAACTSPRSYTGLNDGSHTFAVRAIDAAGNTDANPASLAWTIDTAAPNTTLDSTPPALSNTKSASFALSSSEAGGSFQCSLDGSAFAACDTPAHYSNLADGQHSFAARAIDDVGNTDASPVTFTWTIDTVAPLTVIDSGPAALSASSAASFTFHATKSGSSFQCKLDNGSFAACASPQSYTGLADGSHTFTVRSTDPAGNTDPTPATFSWTIDTVAPDTTITDQPPVLSAGNSANFAFDSSESGGTFQCSLDGSAFAECSSPLSFNNLTDGGHSFAVKAIDAAGNTDTSPATFTWTIDTAAPETTITSQPTNPSASGSAGFSFGSEPGATFQCSLDGSAFAACASPQSYTSLADGSHTFAVRAIDAAGNTDPTPAAYTWTITTAPTYNFSGFLQPVDNLPTLNLVKAGSAIPVKFSLSGYQGMDIFTAGYPKSQTVTCTSTAPVQGIEETVTAGASGLTYDLSTDRYTYVWKTDKAWAENCRQLVVQLKDGSYHRANFKFTR